MKKLKYLWKNYSIAFILASVFLISWGLQFLFTIPLTMQEAEAHHQAFQWSEFWVNFGKDTFENWQSEFLQVLLYVVLTKYFPYKGSNEAKDPEEVKKDLKKK